MTHISDSEDHRVVAAALKMWKDATAKRVFATLYLPDTIYRFEAEIPKDHDQRNLTIPAHQRYQWEPRGEQPQAENPVGEVPVVPFFNRPSLALHGGTSEIDDILPILERCDKLTLDMLLASDSAAFRQKWATGLKVPRDPETKKPIEPYDAAVRKLWVSEDPNSKFGDFSATDLRPYMEVIKGAVADISAISRVPSYYLVSPDLVNPPSADTVRAAEAGLVGKATDLMDSFGESWETVLRLAMTITKNERRNELLKMVWKDPAERSMDKLADAATKWATLGVPHQVLWEQAGATPDDVVRWQTIAAQESMQKTLFAPPTTPTPPPGEPAPEPAPA